jgi:divalent metal cation (Fe/Co/Zn/Cd) transporter
MTAARTDQSARSERTLLTSLLLSAPGPIVTGLAAMSGYSATQIADFIRRTSELVPLFVSWWIFRMLKRRGISDGPHRARLERTANLTLAGALACSGLAMLVIGISRALAYKAGGNVTGSLIIAGLGVLVNTWFWLRYRSFNRAQYDPIIAGQQRLYGAKASVDLCVFLALAAVAALPAHPATRYVDAMGSIIVAGYLLYSGWDLGRKSTS